MTTHFQGLNQLYHTSKLSCGQMLKNVCVFESLPFFWAARIGSGVTTNVVLFHVSTFTKLVESCIQRTEESYLQCTMNNWFK